MSTTPLDTPLPSARTAALGDARSRRRDVVLGVFGDRIERDRGRA